MTPSGYKLHLEKHPGAATWRLVGTVARGLFCHKPCTVSGGGKSEISKNSSRLYDLWPHFRGRSRQGFRAGSADLRLRLFSAVEARLRARLRVRPSRKVLDNKRTLGSVIKLLTPSDDYTEKYNAWLASFPNYIFPIVFIIKRFSPRDSLSHWRDTFGVDSINGFPGHELKAFGRKLVGSYLRVGLLDSQGWRTFKLRQDFSAAAKVQTEDDISASIVVPAEWLKTMPPGPAR